MAVLDEEDQNGQTDECDPKAGREDGPVCPRFKKRQSGTVVTWRLSVLDLATLIDHPLAERRNVDDQAGWLDNNTIIYSIPEDAASVAAIGAANPGPPVLSSGASVATDTWTVPANGGGFTKPTLG